MEGPNERQQEEQGSGLVGASSSAATAATQATEEALAGGGGKTTWSCEQCSLENEEPDAEAVLTSGGIISCVLCLRVRGQYAWHCPDCAFINTLKSHACKMCGHVAFARGKKDGSRSEAAAIARVYKKRRRSKTPGASSKGSVMSPTASLVTKSELGSEEDEASAFASEPAATTPLPSPSPTPSLYPGAAAASEAVREGQSRLFAQQLRAMHCMVRELGRLPEFRSAF